MEHQDLTLSAEEILARRRLQNRIAQRKRRQRRAEMERQREKDHMSQCEEGSRIGVDPVVHQDCIHCHTHQEENSQYPRNSGHEELRDRDSNPQVPQEKPALLEPPPADTASLANLGREQEAPDEMLHSDFMMDRLIDLDAEHDILGGPASISLPSKPSTPLLPTPGSTTTAAESNYRAQLSVALPTPTSPTQARPQFEGPQAFTSPIAMQSPSGDRGHDLARRHHRSVSYAADVPMLTAFPNTPAAPIIAETRPGGPPPPPPSSSSPRRRASCPVHHPHHHPHHQPQQQQRTDTTSITTTTSTSNQGKTALHLSAERGSLPTVQFLLAHHADVDSVDGLGRTALHLAVARGHVAVVDALLRAGADTEAVDLRGRSPIHVAVELEAAHAQAQAQATGGGGLLGGDGGGNVNGDDAVVAAVLGLLVRDGADLNAPIRGVSC
ncbi:hypothetical protein C8A03DRAFT_30895 [Achaetomium macrosporum]|uniref:protein S-acyltransferase n=1 Tax=Achaetomium macrosporum TaxID=79813 RepID=A0AAN7CF46_9PEZI|nr:hypothetical protein C8A03DRAFT_30895 [Achaetomium macrosporum]